MNSKIIFSLTLLLFVHSTFSLNEDCVICSKDPSCFWCDATNECLCDSPGTLHNCTGGWCNGDICTCGDDCARSLFPCSLSTVGQLILLVVYGGILALGAKTISEGSDLLLEILNPGLIGGLLLPILGAIPDAAIIVVSGGLGSQAEAQEQLAVGVGTLAGSTVMLITITWASCAWVARCDLVGGEAVDNTLTKKRSLKETGITVDQDTANNSKIMILSSLSYLIVQGVAFFYLSDPTGASAKRVESYFALAGMIVCFLVLVAYCAYQVMNPVLQEKKMQAARKRALAQSATSAWVKQVKGFQKGTESISSPATEESPLLKEQSPIADIRGIGLKWKKKSQNKEHVGINVEAVPEQERSAPLTKAERKKIAIKATVLLLVGTMVCAIFSDPMVDVISKFAKNKAIWGEKGVNAFYISFIITPFCSNASEFISSLLFAAGKKRVNSSLSFSQMYGAVTMNNSLNLGLFFALVYFRKLSWEYSAETVATLFCVASVGFMTFRKTTFKSYWGLIIVSFYVLSLGIVAFLQGCVGWV